MALILAVNPGNRHSPTLSRLARELRGCELMGAESCPVAIKAIKKRVPDVLLLPAVPANGEAELLAHLKSVPGGVLTLKLPPVESADPIDLARQIRELLTGVPAFTPPVSASVEAPQRRRAPAPAPTPAPPPPAPAPVGASPQLLAAAAATVTWIRARQAQWSEPLPSEIDMPQEPEAPQEPADQPYDFYEPIELPDEPQDPALVADAGAEEGARRNVTALLPRVAALVAVVGIIAAAIIYWPQIRGSSSNAVQSSPKGSEPASATPEPVASQPAAPPAEPPPAAVDLPGSVAVVVPFEVTISESEKPVAMDDQKRAVLTPGKHRLRFQNPERGYDATRTVQVRSNETTTLTLTPETTIGVTSSEPAEVSIDGVRAGETPYQGKLGLGPHTVTVKTAGAERQLSVEATSKPVQLEVDFSKP
jgi:hypothetical protein